ncbi:Alpha/Beta hydrolase protein [Coniella lustricola]|uniref:Alpha/Beta hydrolase protein n=1 Tax=Coniella lustricola TaxID=2025994 RepID=A0A2T3AHY5_9PEZI|nr:Alpha/Beta hydrolase protein [Coniella lustricola]
MPNSKYPLVLAHGLFGFAELKLAGSYLPPIHYWRGIKEALIANGTEVITATVPPSGTIEERAAKLRENILASSKGRPVNIVAHSMGGLDARYMISKSRQKRSLAQEQSKEVENDINVRALVTVATPHHGSAYADFLLDRIGPDNLPTLYSAWESTTGLGTGAFSQLTRKYMRADFNPRTQDDPEVRYFSYGAALTKPPPLLSPFRGSYGVIMREEGPNDGLVSVDSARWGEYKGTLECVSHLDLINWTNRLRWAIRKWMGEPQPFNAIQFYLRIASMLEKEGL